MKKLLYGIILLVMLLIPGCVSKADHQKIIKERDELKQENQQLMDKLNLYRKDMGGATKIVSSEK